METFWVSGSYRKGTDELCVHLMLNENILKISAAVSSSNLLSQILAENLEQDQTPQNVHSGLGATLFDEKDAGCLVVLGFNATLTVKVIPWRSVTHMCFLAFSHQY